VRISTKYSGKDYMKTVHPPFAESYKKVVSSQDHSDEEIASFKKLGIEKAFAILTLDFDKLFNVAEVRMGIPSYAPSHKSIVCDKCGEGVMESRIIEKQGKKMCIPCTGVKGNMLTGNGIE